jgi:hypothetical protein
MEDHVTSVPNDAQERASEPDWSDDAVIEAYRLLLAWAAEACAERAAAAAEREAES